MKRLPFFRKIASRGRGQALVELSLMLALLGLLLMGVIEFGMMLYSYIVVVDATDEAAAYASLYPYQRDLSGNCSAPCRIDNDPDIIQRVSDASAENSIVQTSNYYSIVVTPNYLHRDPCANVTVTTYYRYNFLTPLLFGQEIDLHYQATKVIVPESSYGDCVLPNP